MQLIHAPKLNAQNLPWFNVKSPLDLPDLQGKLVILDFWTFCCINCIHIIPTLKRIEEKFSDSVVVIGVHSPKFPGEKVTENVAKAIDRYEIVHPIVHDEHFTIWKNFTVPVVIRRCPIMNCPPKHHASAGRQHIRIRKKLSETQGPLSRSAVVEYATVTV